MSRSSTDDAEACKVKGNELMAAGDYEGAIKWYAQAIEFNPNNQVYYSNRSAAYLAKGFAEIALKDAEKCISLNPEWPKGYGRKGAALHKMEAYDKAIKAYEDGLKVAPGPGFIPTSNFRDIGCEILSLSHRATVISEKARECSISRQEAKYN
jgi:tetratricopeptide (TPR) repeat protein